MRGRKARITERIANEIRLRWWDFTFKLCLLWTEFTTR